MSLNKSIREVENFLKGIKVSRTTRPLRAELHEKLEELGSVGIRKA